MVEITPKVAFPHVPYSPATSGPSDRRIALVAEAPGDDEVEAGRPLVGASGRVLNALLRASDIERSSLAILNVFDEQAPNNDVEGWTIGRKEWESLSGPNGSPPHSLPKYNDRWLRPDKAWHLDRLARELDEVKPTVIVPMGGAALWAFTGNASITQARGAVSIATYTRPGVKLVPTLHPAHVIHEWRMFTVVMADLQKAVREAEIGPQVVLPKREIWVNPDYQDLERFKMFYLDPAPSIAIDIETYRRQITCISFTPRVDLSLVVPFVDFRRLSRSYWSTPSQEVMAWKWVQAVCALPQPKVLQNGTYDAYYLWDRYRIKITNYSEDTRLVHHALYPELPKSLGFMGALYTRQGPWKLMNAVKKEKRDE